MTLKEKFKQWLDTNPNKTLRDIQLEVIADDFAIGFKDWCDKFTNEVGDWKQDGVCLKNRFSTKELLEIYKKEKQL